MKVLSINVALPRMVSAQGRQVETGIFKTPVAGPVALSRLNLQGDGQADLAVHGGPDKAVYLYSWSNVLYWRDALDRNDLGPGAFGENLTVEGLRETEAAIGDEFAIGTARLVVTQPRLPCFKLALALRAPDIANAFLESGRTGFYLRVLQEGTIQTGDPIYALPARETERVTIAELVEIHRSERASPDQIRRISSLNALPRKWKDRLAAKCTPKPAPL